MTVDKVCNMADNIGRLLGAGKMREKILIGGGGWVVSMDELKGGKRLQSCLISRHN